MTLFASQWQYYIREKLENFFPFSLSPFLGLKEKKIIECIYDKTQDVP